MFVESLELTHFRNYAQLSLSPAPGLNVLVGENAQGKTNLLEAIYLLATTRSLRAGKESEMIRAGAPDARVVAQVNRERDGGALLETVVLPSDRKTVRVNGSKRSRVIDMLGEVNAVFFGAPDLEIVNGDPSERRRFMNVDISQISPRYCADLAAYKRSLDQRNRLLRELLERPRGDSGIEAWNAQIVNHGAPIIEKRRYFISKLASIAAGIHSELTEGAETLSIEYASSIPLGSAIEASDIAELFYAEIERVAPAEFRRGTSLVGPQRDDIRLAINGAEARAFGSQGQQRTVVLSIKLAEFILMEEHVGEPPIMLLDDVLSDLDDDRRRRLLTLLHRRCQTFVTCTNLRAFPSEILEGGAVYRVRAGELALETPSASEQAESAPDPGEGSATL